MLEPTAIHSYEPPAYRTRPPSPSEGPPPSLPFACLVLESANASGGPKPALLHSLREQGCKLILVQFEDTDVAETPQRGGKGSRLLGAALNEEWFDAVFDKVIRIDRHQGGRRELDTTPLERYITDADISPTQVLCFACTEDGARAFASVDTGLIVAPSHNRVWNFQESSGDTGGDTTVLLNGADIAVPTSPSARQLSWLHTVLTQKLWCTCLWFTPPKDELRHAKDIEDLPSMAHRAELTSVASRTLRALGHPSWVRWDGDPACTVRIGEQMVACPDWTPLVPRVVVKKSQRDISDFSKVHLYCHSLDVGIAEVNHAMEAEETDRGVFKSLRVRVSSRRFVSLQRPAQAATECSVILLDDGVFKSPDICIRSSLRVDQILPGFSLHGDPVVDIQKLELSASYIREEDGTIITVRAWHRLVKDDGRGEVNMSLGQTDSGASAHAERIRIPHGPSGQDPCAVDIVFSNPRKGTRYGVEKAVQVWTTSAISTAAVRAVSSAATGTAAVADACSQHHRVAGGQRDGLDAAIPQEDSSLTLPEMEEEHRSAWRSEWDRSDIEIAGTRQAARCQRAVRLFRFHQVSNGDNYGSGRSKAKVPLLVRQLFQATLSDFCEDEKNNRPSSLIKSRIGVHDPRVTNLMVRVDPKVPPACHRLRFNSALGGRWHRFTLTPGIVRILAQGPILVSTLVQLHGDIVNQPPKFYLPGNDGDGVEVRASPWHEVQVQHALTDLGRPDGSTGGFYSLMRRSRFLRVEVLRRLLGDGEGDYKDETLTQPLRNALDQLRSVPRPPGWRKGDGEDLHILKADATTRAHVLLEYEKRELIRDIAFLEERFVKFDGRISAGEDICSKSMTVQQAKDECVRLPGCRGFCFQGDAANLGNAEVMIYFKGEWELEQTVEPWTSYRFEDGEVSLLEMLRESHDQKFMGKNIGSTNGPVLSWDESLKDAVSVLKAAARGSQGWDGEDRPSPPLSRCVSSSERRETAAREKENEDRASSSSTKPFRNFITDRDGTTNNYCDRYASSVQSAYNAAWLGHFAKHCTENAVIITAAPLGGRPSAEGLMELSVAPRGVLTYTGSKGREYFDYTTQRVLEAEVLPSDQREMVEELHRRIHHLCGQPGNAKFLGIGSGLQRKFGEVTMARNDPAGTIPEPESRRFMADVRRIKEEMDPDGTDLDLHDTNTDLEIFPRVVGGRASFDKGSGVKCLDKKLKLQVGLGPNLICGDTDSDVVMIEAALALMCGEKMVEVWLSQMREDEGPGEPGLEDVAASVMGGLTRQDSEHFFGELTDEEQAELERVELEREEEEQQARENASQLAVLFVNPPAQHSKKPKIANRVQTLCQLSGAQCALVPSPDVLVAALAQYANEISGRTVTEPARICEAYGTTSPHGSPLLAQSSPHGSPHTTPVLPSVERATSSTGIGDAQGKPSSPQTTPTSPTVMGPLPAPALYEALAAGLNGEVPFSPPDRMD